MSYILEALRKAEADRKLGEAVSLHDPTPASLASAEPVATSLPRWLPAAAATALVALVAALGWWWATHRASNHGKSAEALAVAAPTSDAQASEASPPAEVTSQRSAHTTVAPDHDADVVQLPQPAAQASTQTKPAYASSTHTASNAAPASAATATAETAVRLTPELRATLPPLAVGGAMYSDVPASRMVVINGQLFHEGDTVAADVVLEKIQLKSAILRARGQRYLLEY